MATRKQIDIILEGKDRASGVLKRVGASIGNFAKNAAKVGALAAAAISAAIAAAVVKGVKDQFSEIDRLAKVSAKLGIPTEKLAGLTLQADEMGVSFDLVQKSITKMTVAIADAANGIGIAKDEFALLGLNVDDLKNKRTDLAFRDIADAIQNQSDKQLKLNAIYKIFGGRSTELIGLLEGGSAAMDEFADKAVRFGTAISNVDAKKIEDVNDAIRELQEIGKGGLRALAIVIAPGLKKGIKDLIDFLAPATTVTQEDFLQTQKRKSAALRAEIKSLGPIEGFLENKKANELFDQLLKVSKLIRDTQNFLAGKEKAREKTAAAAAAARKKADSDAALADLLAFRKKIKMQKDLNRLREIRETEPDLILQLGRKFSIDIANARSLIDRSVNLKIAAPTPFAGRGGVGGADLGKRRRGLLEIFQGTDPTTETAKNTKKTADGVKILVDGFQDLIFRLGSTQPINLDLP